MEQRRLSPLMSVYLIWSIIELFQLVYQLHSGEWSSHGSPLFFILVEAGNALGFKPHIHPHVSAVVFCIASLHSTLRLFVCWRFVSGFIYEFWCFQANRHCHLHRIISKWVHETRPVSSCAGCLLLALCTSPSMRHFFRVLSLLSFPYCAPTYRPHLFASNVLVDCLSFDAFLSIIPQHSIMALTTLW